MQLLVLQLISDLRQRSLHHSEVEMLLAVLRQMIAE